MSEYRLKPGPKPKERNSFNDLEFVKTQVEIVDDNSQITRDVITIKPKDFNRRYKPEYCAALIKHMAEGFSFETFGADLLVTSTTLYNWSSRYPEFKTAREIGTLQSKKFWERLGLQYCKEGKSGDKLNSAVWGLVMKNRFGWDNKSDEKSDSNYQFNFNMKLDINQLSKLSVEEKAAYLEKGLLPEDLSRRGSLKVKENRE